MLKKSSLLILSILLSSSMLFAQGFHLGAKFGTDIQKVTGKPFSDKFAFGYHLGLYGEIMINSKISIQPELYYSAANFDTASNFSTVYNSITLSKLKFGYINVPILLSIKASKNFAIQAGPRFAILTDKSLSIKSNASNAVKSGDVSMVAGVQFSFSKVRVYGRYQIGLSDLNNTDNETLGKWKSQTIHIGVGINIL